MTISSVPIIAVTMGDPSGCGPEIIAKVAASGALKDSVQTIVVGNTRVMKSAFEIIGASYRVRGIAEPQEAQFDDGVLNVIETETSDLDGLEIGKPQSLAGQAAYEAILRSIDLAMTGQVAGVVTSAINKSALALAGHHYDGHTEIFALRTGGHKVTMMLASGSFRVTHISTHCALNEAVRRCKTQRILEVIRLTHQGTRLFGIPAPRVAVAGLNPHSGEGGLFGAEEAEQVQPAIDLARAEGMNVYPTPVPADTVFVRMREFGEFDVVVAQYHDQGHVAAKLVDFWGGVNITLGLPIIRTSVDHGTAFDIAGTGKARPDSLINAIRYAHLMSSAKTAEDAGVQSR